MAQPDDAGLPAATGTAVADVLCQAQRGQTVGLVFVWAALVGLVTQFYLNMEIERHTSATSETALFGG
jgi:hypothetical protein